MLFICTVPPPAARPPRAIGFTVGRKEHFRPGSRRAGRLPSVSARLRHHEGEPSCQPNERDFSRRAARPSAKGRSLSCLAFARRPAHLCALRQSLQWAPGSVRDQGRRPAQTALPNRRLRFHTAALVVLRSRARRSRLRPRLRPGG